VSDGRLGRAAARRLLEDALRRSEADQTEVVLAYEQSGLTRFTDNYVHQNVADGTPTITVRAAYGTRVGIASVVSLDRERIARAVERATATARVAPPNGGFPGLPGPRREPTEVTDGPEVAACPPEARAAIARTACRLARDAGVSAAGSVATTRQEIAVANSLGVFAYTARASARLVVVARGDSGSGYAQGIARESAALDAEQVARRAVAVGRRAQRPVEAPPGDYAVVLQPEAVGDIVRFVAVVGCGAQAASQGRSFLAGRRGQKVCSERITMWDDGDDPAGLPLPFDFEGVPRQRLSLIDRGVAGDIALDSFYAARMGIRTNGHAVPLAHDLYDAGPVPLHVFVAPGPATVEEMIASTTRGLLITRFHYTRLVHPSGLVVTGMTRDGTFLIEHGELTHPVKSLRFTQSYVDALRDVSAVGRETRLTGEWLTGRVPALKVGRFAFTGATE
jgi:predicted Zn-dependent protease